MGSLGSLGKSPRRLIVNMVIPLLVLTVPPLAGGDRQRDLVDTIAVVFEFLFEGFILLIQLGIELLTLL